MEFQTNMLRPEELATLKLRGIYEQYGYKKYRMGRFEEYSLYAKNQSFLASENIITFTDLDGKLLALKPDVTLSIIKNSKATRDMREKLYYIESVYRESKESHTYKEISQMGLEVMGAVDLYTIIEVLALAERSLAELSDRYLLEISNMDYVTGLMEGMPLDEDQKQEILDLIRDKNSFELKNAAKRAGLNDWECEALEALPGLYGPFTNTLKEAVKYVKNETMERAVADLGKLYQAMRSLGLEEHLQLDFSLLNDIDYYNGIIFQGYLEQLPRNVLAGGQYDGMVKKLGKKCDGIGFAIYLSEMSRIPLPQREFDVEALILYEDGADYGQLILQAHAMTKQGLRVRVEREIPKQLRCEKIYRWNGELTEVESC
ncbi:MAG: ATP phosphoribosyltransferase regulatory subunit [Firmicutes bacterium]|nr:ATP phosphoribosyltransferase regulatory subunit [Bacillota bacterium]